MKLSQSRASLQYLEKTTESFELPQEVKDTLERAADLANDKITSNQVVYNQSNAFSHEMIVSTNEKRKVLSLSK